MIWPAFVRDLQEDLDMRFSLYDLKSRGFFRRHHRRMLFGSVVMLAFYFGRFTASRHWWDVIPLIPWIAASRFWHLQLRGDLKRERDELDEVMNKTREEILRRAGESL